MVKKKRFRLKTNNGKQATSGNTGTSLVIKGSREIGDKTRIVTNTEPEIRLNAIPKSRLRGVERGGLHYKNSVIRNQVLYSVRNLDRQETLELTRILQDTQAGRDKYYTIKGAKPEVIAIADRVDSVEPNLRKRLIASINLIAFDKPSKKRGF